MSCKRLEVQERIGVLSTAPVYTDTESCRRASLASPMPVDTARAGRGATLISQYGRPDARNVSITDTPT